MAKHSITVLFIFLGFSIFLHSDDTAEQMSAASVINEIIKTNGPKAAMEKAEEINSDKTDIYKLDETEFLKLAEGYMNSGKYSEAYTMYRITRKLIPTSVEALTKLGEMYGNMGNNELALQSYEKILEIALTSTVDENTIAKAKQNVFEFRNETTKKPLFEIGQNTKIKGPYLGQTPPGLEPKPFAPGIVSTFGGFEFAITFSPDGNEIYFNRGADIFTSRLKEEGWTAPEQAPFNTPGLDHEAHITSDGKIMFFGSVRVRPEKTEPEYAIWAMDRAKKGWGEPYYVISGSMYISTSAKGEIYATNIDENFFGGIFKIINRDGKYSKGEFLKIGSDSSFKPAHPCIAPDDSYIIFDAKVHADRAEGDIFISFAESGDRLSEPQPIIEINTPGDEMAASISPDGKYLFFHSHRDICWIDIKILEKYKAKASGMTRSDPGVGTQ